MNYKLWIWGILIVWTLWQPMKNNLQFSYLARSLAEGKTYFVEMPGDWRDTVEHDGKRYWPLGPFPALFLVPGAAIGGITHQGYAQAFLVLATGFLVYWTARKRGFSKNDSSYLVLAFAGGSAYLALSLSSSSWYFAQITAVFLAWLSWAEYQGKRRWLLIGLVLAALALTRTTAALLAVFYAGDILWEEKDKAKKLAQLGLQILGGILIWAGYNYIRFGNIWEQGYAGQLLIDSLEKARSYGLLSWRHIPSNLYYLFLAGPMPVWEDSVSKVMKFPFYVAGFWGMSIFITSPYLVKLASYPYRDKLTRLLWLAVIAIAVPLLFYYGIGYIQVGYRYSMDFFVPLFWILMESMANKNEKLSGRLKALILALCATNYYWRWSQYFQFLGK